MDGNPSLKGAWSDHVNRLNFKMGVVGVMSLMWSILNLGALSDMSGISAAGVVKFYHILADG